MVPLKRFLDDALQEAPSVEHVIKVRRTGDAAPVNFVDGRDLWWHDLVKDASPVCEPEPQDSEHPLYILYTSGTTGKPKGVVHTTGGYLRNDADRQVGV